MSHKSIFPGYSEYSPAHAELELVHLLNENSDQGVYPWAPSDLAAADYFNQLDQQPVWDGSSEADLAEQSQTFFAGLDRLWLQDSLATQFAQRVPQNILTQICQQAQAVLSENLSRMEQLVACVRDVLPSLAEEDLQVLARPMAYAMRDEASNMTESVLAAIRALDWAALSEIEQARLGLTIAYEALSQLDDRA